MLSPIELRAPGWTSDSTGGVEAGRSGWRGVTPISQNLGAARSDRMSFTITAMDSGEAEACRQDALPGQAPARRVVLDEPGAPCRHCLRPGQTGETMLLLTYQPFRGPGPYAVASPIYLHADPCPRYQPSSDIPMVVASGLRAVRAYDAAHDLLDGDVTAGTDLEPLIQRLLDDHRASYLHVYSATAGCFTCRVDRA